MNQEYDITLLFSATNTDEQILAIENDIKALIEKYTGQIIKVGEPSRRRLAYVIAKIRNGVYKQVRFSVENTKIDQLKKELQLLPELLRFTITKAKDLKKPSYNRQNTEDGPKNDYTKPEPEKKEVKEEKEPEKKASSVSIEELDAKINEILDQDAK